MMNPDIITGISLMLMFVFFGRLLGATTSLGFWSMLAAHITFCLPVCHHAGAAEAAADGPRAA